MRGETDPEESRSSLCDSDEKGNWIDLSVNSKLPLTKKRGHVEGLIRKKRKDLNFTSHEESFVSLAFQLRTYAIILSYFPVKSSERRRYLSHYSKIDEHPAWKDSLTSEEREILQIFQTSIQKLKKNREETQDFVRADRMFGSYRYRRWKSSQSKTPLRDEASLESLNQ